MFKSKINKSHVLCYSEMKLEGFHIESRIHANVNSDGFLCRTE